MILMVEDNQDDSYLLTRQLARAHLENYVRVIGDGQDALDHLLECDELPQVVFLDLRLPRLSGIELLRRLRRDKRFQALPIVVMTGALNSHEVEECTKLGITAYLPKPIGIETFSRLLHPLLAEACLPA